MLLGLVVGLALLVSGAALGGEKTQAHPQPKVTFGLFKPRPGQGVHGQRPFATCSSNCSFPEGNIGLILNVTDSPCDGSYSFDVDPGDGTGLITNIPITGTCDTSQNPSVFTGSGSTTHLYSDESSGAYTVTFYWHDPDVGVIPGSLSLTLTEGDSMTGQGINISFTPGAQFTKQLATFTDTGLNGYTAPASDMFPTVDWGDGSPPGSTLDATVSVSGSGGTFTVTGTHTYSSSGPWLITITLQDDQPGTALPKTHAKASVRTFTASPTTDVLAGSSISYQGSGFDGSGSPIVIGWDDLLDPVVKTTLPAQTSFTGTQTATFAHPVADPTKACMANLTATQDGATDTLQISGTQQQVVLADRNILRLVNGQAQQIHPPDYTCHGEQVGANRQPIDLLTEILRQGYQLPGGAEAVLAAQDFPAGPGGADGSTVPVVGYVNRGELLHGVMRIARGATLCLPLGPSFGAPPSPNRVGFTYGSMTIPPSDQGPFRAGTIGSSCASSAPTGTGVDVVDTYGPGCQGAASIPPGTHRGPLTVDGIACVQGSLKIAGDLRFGGGSSILEVIGNLTVTGDISGIGTLFVNGGTVIQGSFEAWQTDDQLLIAAGGDVMVGKD